MADNNDTTTFRLDLDADNFIEVALKAKSAVDGIGSSEGVSDLIENLSSAAPMVAGFGAALFAVKETIDLVFDAEKIRQTQVQFEALSTQAGVFSGTLLKGLQEASKGWVDDTTLMQAANKALLELEVGAEKLPELMDLARKATAVMGGDLVANFEAISQAVASGNTRQLRHLGIVVDQQKAYRDYAQSIGVSVEALNQAGRQQAVLNAALDEGHKKFGQNVEDVRASITAWQQVKATLTEIGEVMTLAFERIAGPTVKNFFSNLKSMADDAKTYIQDKFGSGAEQSAAHLQRVQERIMEIKGALVDLDQKSLKGTTTAFDTSQMVAYQAELKKLEAELPKVQAIVTKNADVEKAKAQEVANAKGTIRTVDSEKEKAQRAKVAQELAAIDAQLLQEQEKTMTTLDQATQIYQAHLQQAGAKVQAEIDQVKAKEAQGILTHQQANEELVRLNKLKDMRMRQDNDELWRVQEQALNNYVRQSQNAFDGVGRAFSATAQRSKHDLQDWGKFGDNTVSAFSKNATSNIQAWGAGTKSATDAIEGMFAGMAGQMASQYGEMMMLASIWPPNPPAFAAGVALIALGGLLGGIAGGGAKTSTSGAAVSAPSATAPDVTASTGGAAPTSANASQPATSKSTNIVIQGHMLMSDQTQRWLVDQIRAAADSTDFKIQSVGGGL